MREGWAVRASTWDAPLHARAVGRWTPSGGAGGARERDATRTLRCARAGFFFAHRRARAPPIDNARSCKRPTAQAS